MADTPAPSADADPLQSADMPGVQDDAAPGDSLSEGLRAVRDAPAAPGAADIAADDAGATAEAEALGDTVGKG